jgi:hypothetical protein
MRSAAPRALRTFPHPTTNQSWRSCSAFAGTDAPAGFVPAFFCSCRKSYETQRHRLRKSLYFDDPGRTGCDRQRQWLTKNTFLLTY